MRSVVLSHGVTKSAATCKLASLRRMLRTWQRGRSPLEEFSEDWAPRQPGNHMKTDKHHSTPPPKRCPFLALSVQQGAANGSKRRHKAKVGNRRIPRVMKRDPAASGKLPQSAANASFFPPVNRRVAGSSPARGANVFNNLRTTDLSSDHHVALFRGHFLRVFLRHPKAPGCSRSSDHISDHFLQPLHLEHDPAGESRHSVSPAPSLNLTASKLLPFRPPGA
jgi:hypothetical protein